MTFAVNARGAFFPAQAMLAAEARLSPKSAAEEYAMVQSDGRQTAKLFGIRLAPKR